MSTTRQPCRLPANWHAVESAEVVPGPLHYPGAVGSGRATIICAPASDRSMEGCTFCRILADGRDVVYANEHFFGVFDRFPASPGHCEVVPREHMVSLMDLPSERAPSMLEAVCAMVGILEETDLGAMYGEFAREPIHERSRRFCEAMLTHPGLRKKPDGYNIGVNEGRAAGRTIDHLHIHILPRHQGDVKDHVGGIRHILKGMGNYTRDDAGTPCRGGGDGGHRDDGGHGGDGGHDEHGGYSGHDRHGGDGGPRGCGGGRHHDREGGR